MLGEVDVDLRGKDPLTLEVELGTIVRSPIRALSVGTLADLMALCERDDLPPAVKSHLRGFPLRVETEIADLPSGTAFGAFIRRLGEVPPARVPATLRQLVELEAAKPKRDVGDVSAIHGVATAWEETPPRPIRVATGEQAERPRVTTAPTSGSVEPRFAGGGRTRGGGGSRERAPSAPRRTPRAVEVIDEARLSWVRAKIIERLSRTSNGLLEPVLLSSVSHSGREAHPGLTAEQVKQVAKQMIDRRELVLSAGRYKLRR